MAPDQGTRPSFREQANFMVNAGLFACDVTSLPLLVLLNGRLGSRRIGVQALLTLVLIPLWASLWPGEDPGPMLCVLLVFVLACFASRFGVVVRLLSRDGDREHRNSDGRPRIGRLIPWLRGSAGEVIQAFMVLLGGLFVMAFDPAVGSFVALAAVTRLVMLAARRAVLRERVAAMRDQWIEQQSVMEEFRRLGGGRR